MLYYFLKFYVRCTLLLFCKRITIHRKEAFKLDGPLLIGANHPNSFFDAILVGTYMKKPVYFMTRSDVFRFRLIRFILHQLKMIPVYRIRDGKDKLSLNEKSFFDAGKALKNGNHVLIFVEGFCNYQTTLQPLKKGGARILLQSWNEQLPVQLLPLWIRYHSFFQFGKEIDLIPGQVVDRSLIQTTSDFPQSVQEVNREISAQLLKLSAEQKHPARYDGAIWLLPFAAAGFLLHAPFYYLFHPWVRSMFKKSVHYDSVLFSLMALFYPVWLLVLGGGIYYIWGIYQAVALVFSMPILARAFVLWK